MNYLWTVSASYVYYLLIVDVVNVLCPLLIHCYRTIAVLMPLLRRFLYTHYWKCWHSDNLARRAG